MVKVIELSNRFKVIAFLTFLFVLFPFIRVFSLDLTLAEKIYQSYFENSSQFGSYVRKVIHEDLPLYRFFKIHFVGSSEKTETTKKTGDYLLTLKPFENVNSDEEALAKAMYLSYWEAKLNNKLFDVEIVKNSPVFNEFFSQYQIRVSQAFGNFAQDLTAYLFGVNLSLDHLPEDLKNLRKEIIKDYNYEKVYNGEEEEAITILLSRPDVIKTISDIILEAQQTASEFDAETLIMRTRGSIFRSTFVYIAGLKDEIAVRFVKITPKEMNLSWIRWIVYVVVFIIWYFIFKNINLPLTLFIASETVYIASFFSIQSTIDGMLYGIVFAIAIIFSIFYFLSKKKYNYAIISILTLIVLFIPSFFTEDLLMKNTFSNSPFYGSLVNDLLKDSLGKVQRNLKEYNSVVNESIQAFSNLVSELNEEANVQEEYFEPESFLKRIEFAKSLKVKYKDHLKDIEDFIYFENGRYKKIEKLVKTFENLFSKVVSISSEDFKEEIISFVQNNFSEKTANRILEVLKKAKTEKTVATETYKVKNSLSALILLSIGLFLIALNMKEAFIPLVGSLAVSVLTLFKYQEIFVQVGVPSTLVYVNFSIPYTLVLVLVCGFIWLYSNNILRRRERV